MRFRICNAVPTFQKLIDLTFSGCPFIFCYLDDWLIFSANVESHECHLQKALSRLCSASLSANKSKKTFFKT